MNQSIIYALISAIFAALVSIFGKVGLSGLNANVATAVRAIIMAMFLIAVVIFQGNVDKFSTVLADKKALLFVACSGIAGAMSWLFYFLALKNGNVSQIAPIDKLSVVFAVILAILIFNEKISLIHGFGIALIAIGGLILVLF